MPYPEPIFRAGESQKATLAAAMMLSSASENLDEIIRQVNAREGVMPMSDAIILAQLQVDFARGMIELANRL